jgi:hypothetical protein
MYFCLTLSRINIRSALKVYVFHRHLSPCTVADRVAILAGSFTLPPFSSYSEGIPLTGAEGVPCSRHVARWDTVTLTHSGDVTKHSGVVLLVTLGRSRGLRFPSFFSVLPGGLLDYALITVGYGCSFPLLN